MVGGGTSDLSPDSAKRKAKRKKPKSPKKHINSSTKREDGLKSGGLKTGGLSTGNLKGEKYNSGQMGTMIKAGQAAGMIDKFGFPMTEI